MEDDESTFHTVATLPVWEGILSSSSTPNIDVRPSPRCNLIDRYEEQFRRFHLRDKIIVFRSSGWSLIPTIYKQCSCAPAFAFLILFTRSSRYDLTPAYDATHHTRWPTSLALRSCLQVLTCHGYSRNLFLLRPHTSFLFTRSNRSPIPYTRSGNPSPPPQLESGNSN